MTRFFTAYCYERSGNKTDAGKSLDYVKEFRNPDGDSSPLGNEIARLVKENNNDFKSITGKLLQKPDSSRDMDLLREFSKGSGLF